MESSKIFFSERESKSPKFKFSFKDDESTLRNIMNLLGKAEKVKNFVH